MRVKKALIMILLLLPLVVHAGELNISNDQDGCVLLESNGNYLLIDSCTNNSSIYSLLKRKNVTSIDILLTNYRDYRFVYDSNGGDSSIDGGAETSTDNSDIRINKLYIPDVSGIKKYLTDEFKAKNEDVWNILNGIYNYNMFLKSFGKKQNAEVVELKFGDSFKLGDATIDIVAPTQEFTLDDNGNFSKRDGLGLSLVPMVSIDNTKYLLFDDLGYESASDLLLKNQNLKVDMVHLGSENRSSCNALDFLKALKPLYVYFSSYYEVAEMFTAQAIDCYLDTELPSIANVYSGERSGVVTWNVKDGVISTKRCDNCSKVDVNYIDKNTKKGLDTYSSYYSSGLPYYLDIPKKEFKNYKYVDDDITDGDVIRGDRVFTVNYEEIPVVINHKYDSNSDEAKVVMLVQKYVNDNLRSKLYLNNLRDWNALSVEYIGDTPEGKEYYLKTSVDCDGDKTCIEDATDFDSNNNQYLYNAYVIVDGNSNVKLSFEKSSLVEDEIGEGEVENPKTGSYISLFIVMTAFLMIVAIGFIVRKNKIYNIR